MEIAAESVEELDFGAEFAEPVGEFAGRVLEFGEPADDVEIAEAAGGFLDIGFKVVDGVLEFFLAFAGLADEVAEERLAFAGDELGEAGEEALVELGVATEEALIEQADGEFEVGGVVFAALLDGMDRVGDAEAAIPADAQKRGEGVPRLFVGGRPVHEQHDVDIGVREKLRSTVAPDSQHRHPFRDGRRQVFEESRTKYVVD
jgi:hypothetical protein